MSLVNIIRVAPLATSSAALMCSATQHMVMTSIIQPTIPPSTRHAHWFPFFASYKRVVFLSAPCHLSTIFFSLLNLGVSNAPIYLWLGAIAFVFAHAYPLQVGMEHFGLTEEAWKRKSTQEADRFLEGFVEINGRRLWMVDIPGWTFALLGVVANMMY